MASFLPIRSMNNMKLHQATHQDFEKVKNAYIDIINNTPNMEQHARWVYGKHPTDEIIQSYIEEQAMYFLEHDAEVAAVMALTMSQDEDYHDIHWAIPCHDEEVAVVHILAVTPAFQKQGLGNKIIQEAINLAKEKGKKAIRLDSMTSNTPAHHMYQKMGFQQRGQKEMYTENTGWTEFYFFELVC